MMKTVTLLRQEKLIPSSSTHRFGCKTNETVGELHKDAIGHDVPDAANQLHPHGNLREIFGHRSFLQ